MRGILERLAISVLERLHRLEEDPEPRSCREAGRFLAARDSDEMVTVMYLLQLCRYGTEQTDLWGTCEAERVTGGIMKFSHSYQESIL